VWHAGAVTPVARRREIYALCRRHGVLILEDDPYFYLQFAPGGGAPRGLRGLGESYLSLDADGRVIRLDSFSKARRAAAACLGGQACVEWAGLDPGVR
jgi:DNA-binding transcriptional MocR family regulator